MFIYVFSESNRDKLEQIGFKLVYGNTKEGVWIFLNDPALEGKIDDDMERVTASKLIFDGCRTQESGE